MKKKEQNKIFDKPFLIFLGLGAGALALMSFTTTDGKQKTLSRNELNAFIAKLKQLSSTDSKDLQTFQQYVKTYCDRDLLLKKGVIGAEVAVLQWILAGTIKDFDLSDIDGVFGSETLKVLGYAKSLQEIKLEAFADVLDNN